MIILSVNQIPYQSFCWVIGTTSFRTAKLNLKIEEQLLLLNDFKKDYVNIYGTWEWDKQSQELYYDFMKERRFVTGEALRKAKDSREKTSGLVNIGLINGNRTITEAGYELLNVAKTGKFTQDNCFYIEKDSYIFFKQLLKTSKKVGSKIVRPYLILVKVLTELDYLTFDEFTYILPLIIDKRSLHNIINRIKEYRKKEISIENIIFENLMMMDNYNLAYNLLMSKPITEDLICSMGMNRKSRKYDKSYYSLLKELINVFYYNKEDSLYALYLAANKINQRPGVLWRNLLFIRATKKYIRQNGINALKEDCIFNEAKTLDEIKSVFFKYMHVFKAMATLSDYFDLNRRYLKITDTLVFEDNRVRLDLIPRYFFNECIDDIHVDMFSENLHLGDNVPLEKISPKLVFKEKIIYSRLSKDLGIEIKTPEQARAFIKDERYRRFNKLIEVKFTDEVLLKLLDCFETRNDKKIEELVTDEASIPTIFEYILGIIWYKVSEKHGDILKYMKLSLEANLLPKTHATGGSADIIYEYEYCEDYPKHSLLIEATLSDGISQRRMEMEPVSRHLGEFLLKSNNPFDYSLFISTFLHRNVISDFRGRKDSFYYGEDNKVIKGMKIISLDTVTLKKIIKKNINYRYLYKVFQKYYESDLTPLEHQKNLIKESTRAFVK